MGYKNPEAQRAYQRQWMAARRAEWLAENGPCALCGSWVELVVDHVDPTTKRFNPSRLWSLARDNPHRVAELAKCRVLCLDCHNAKSSGEHAKGIDHGLAKLTERDVEEVRKLCREGVPQRLIAQQFGISQTVVSLIHRRRTWRHVS